MTERSRDVAIAQAKTIQEIARQAATDCFETLDLNAPQVVAQHHAIMSMADAVAVAVLQHLADLARERGGVYYRNLADAMKEFTK